MGKGRVVVRYAPALYSPALIPNREGLTITVLLDDKTTRLATVERDERGCHRLRDLHISRVKGWFV